MLHKLIRLALVFVLLVSVTTILSAGQSINENLPNLALDQLPLIFEANRGQVDASVRFLSRSGSYSVFLQPNKTVLAIPARAGLNDSHPTQAANVALELLNANGVADAEGVDLLPGKSNYFIGAERKKWVSGIPQFGKVRFKSVYPGIDLVYYGGENGLEYDFILSAGADARQLAFRVTGSDRIELDKAGDLSLRVGDGTIRLRRPTIYQEKDGHRHEVSGQFVLRHNNEIALAIGEYDRSQQLVVDPVLSYSTLIGANNSAQVQGVAVDPAGNILITGTTFATNYPTVKPFQATNNGYTDVFVTKLNAAGNTILYSTYIGSSGFDTGRAIAVDGLGNAYITGSIGGGDFPTTPGAYITACGSNCGGSFLAKFLSDGEIGYSTFLPTAVNASSVAVDTAGAAYITGSASAGLPLLNAFQTTQGGSFVEKINPGGSALDYSTYLGGTTSDTGQAITVDSLGSAYVVGNTTSANFPLKNPLQTGYVGFPLPNAFISKLSPDGSSLAFSTYLGGSSTYFFSYAGDFATGVAVDHLGNVHVVGTSSSCDFPLTLTAWSTDCASGEYTQKVFVTTLNPSGTQMLFSTFLENGFSEGIAVDTNGNTYVTGLATLNNFPLLNAIEGSPQGAITTSPFSSNSFVTELDLSGKIVFSTYIGQTGGGTQTAGIALDSKGGIYLAGGAGGDFPLLHQIPTQTRQTTNYTLFLAKVAQANVPQLSLSPRVSPILTLRNVSSVPLTISAITPSVNFTKEGDCEKTLPPGTACTLLLIGKDDKKTSGTVTIASNATSTPQTLTIYKSPTGDSVGANLSIYPMYVQFPWQLLGSTSAAQQVVITNSGPLPAAINSIALIQPAAFTEVNDCPGLLEPFSQCTINITYTAASGNDSAQLAIVTDPNQTRQTVFVNGYASNSAILASVSSVDFGLQFVGAQPLARIVNFTNTSTYPATITGLSVSQGFSQVNTCTAPLAPQAECRVAVSYIPATNESPTGQLTASNLGPGGPQAVTLYGTGQILSALAASPIPVSVYAKVGQLASAAVTLTNTSSSTMSLSSFTVTGPFTQSNNCKGSLTAGSSCTLTVNFKPTKAGTFNGTIAIAHTGLGSPQVVPVVGTATTVFYLDPASVTYGQVQVGTPSVGYLGMANGGNSNVTVNSITVQGADFKLTKNGCPTVFPPFEGCADVEITFTPSATGLRTGTATVTVSDSSTPLVAPLQGIGVSQGVGTLSVASMTFAEQTVGTTSSAQTVTLKNTGTGALTLAGVVASTQFVQSSTCGKSLAVGAKCTISVKFAPTVEGILEGTLTVQDDGAGSPHVVSLTGIGQ